MSEVPTTRIEGKYTDAIVFLPEDEIEDSCYEQIQWQVNSPAFQNPVRIMSDAHFSPGSTVGFTMPLTNRVSVQTVGVDCGCGLLSVKLSNYEFNPNDKEELLELDERVRDAVPMGRKIHDWDDDNYHMGEDFPYEEFRQKWVNFATNHLDDDIDLGRYHPDNFNPDVEYFKEICEKTHYNPSKASNTVGSLGQGNHFLEFALDSNGDLWLTIHSGSRGFGKAIADYHQTRSEQLRNTESSRNALRELPDKYLNFVKFDLEEVSDHDLLDWLQGGMGESFVDYESLKREYAETENAGKIEEIGNQLKTAIPDHDANTEGDGDIPYLEGEEAVEYYVDLAFGQTYASENRKVMARLAADAIGADIIEEIEAVHNYIDYEDGIIRKGATPAREGQMVIIPMNMADGTFIARGKGNEEWNQSVCHGAGRVMSRGKAFDELSEEKHAKLMGETVATELPLDEHPLAYKDTQLITNMIGPTVDVVDHLDPILNLKAPE